MKDERLTLIHAGGGSLDDVFVSDVSRFRIVQALSDPTARRSLGQYGPRVARVLVGTEHHDLVEALRTDIRPGLPLLDASALSVDAPLAETKGDALRAADQHHRAEEAWTAFGNEFEAALAREGVRRCSDPRSSVTG